MTPTELARIVADDLQGTAKSLTASLDAFDAEGMENNTEFCAELDQLVFLCEQCGWWFEQSEMADDCGDDWKCEECGQ